MAKILDKDPVTYQRERDGFLRELRQFHDTRGTPFRRIPKINGHEVDLYLLYVLVTEQGGWEKVNSRNEWEALLEQFNVPRQCVNSGVALKQLYIRFLDRYEKVHYLGEDVDRDDEDGDEESRHRRRSVRALHSVPLAYNHHQHNVPDTARSTAGLSTNLYKPSDYDRLALSLLSPLPNEQDFAINVCTLLSNEGKHTLKLDKCPRLIDFLLAHAGIYNHPSLREVFTEVYGKVRRHSMYDFWMDVIDDPDFWDLTDETFKDGPDIVSPAKSKTVAQGAKAVANGEIATVNVEVEKKESVEVGCGTVNEGTGGSPKESTDKVEAMEIKNCDRLEVEEKSVDKVVLVSESIESAGCVNETDGGKGRKLKKNRQRRRSRIGNILLEESDNELFCLGRNLGTAEFAGQRVLQIATILRNLSFEEENIPVMAKNSSFLRFLLLCAQSKWNCLCQMGFDALGNIAAEIGIEDPVSDQLAAMLLATLTKGLASPDRFIVLSCLEILNKLSQNDENEEVMLRCLDQKVYDQVCMFLTLHDIMLLVYTLECLYSLTSLGERACNSIVRVHGAIDTLVSLITVEAQSYGPKACILMRVVETVSGTAPMPNVNPSVPPPNALTTMSPMVASNVPFRPSPVIQRHPQMPQRPMIGVPQPAVATPVNLSAAQQQMGTSMVAPAGKGSATAPLTTPIHMVGTHHQHSHVMQHHHQQQLHTGQSNQLLHHQGVVGTTPPAIHQQHQQQMAQENEQFALAWIRATYDQANGCSIEQADLYRQYLASCAKIGRRGVITALQFPRCVRTVFGNAVGPIQRVSSSGATEYHYEGIKVRANALSRFAGGPSSMPNLAGPTPLSNPPQLHQAQPPLLRKQVPPIQHQQLLHRPDSTASPPLVSSPVPSPTPSVAPCSPILKAQLSAPPKATKGESKSQVLAHPHLTQALLGSTTGPRNSPPPPIQHPQTSSTCPAVNSTASPSVPPPPTSPTSSPVSPPSTCASPTPSSSSAGTLTASSSSGSCTSSSSLIKSLLASKVNTGPPDGTQCVGSMPDSRQLQPQKSATQCMSGMTVPSPNVTTTPTQPIAQSPLVTPPTVANETPLSPESNQVAQRQQQQRLLMQLQQQSTTAPSSTTLTATTTVSNPLSPRPATPSTPSSVTCVTSTTSSTVTTPLSQQQKVQPVLSPVVSKTGPVTGTVVTTGIVNKMNEPTSPRPRISRINGARVVSMEVDGKEVWDVNATPLSPQGTWNAEKADSNHLSNSPLRGRRDPPQPPPPLTPHSLTPSPQPISSTLPPPLVAIGGVRSPVCAPPPRPDEDSNSGASSSTVSSVITGSANATMQTTPLPVPSNTPSASDGDENSLTSFEGLLLNGGTVVPHSLDIDGNSNIGGGLVSNDDDSSSKDSARSGLSRLPNNNSGGGTTKVKGMLADLLEKKVGPREPLINGVLGKELRIGERGLELVENHEMTEENDNPTESGNGDSQLIVSSSNATPAGVVSSDAIVTSGTVTTTTTTTGSLPQAGIPGGVVVGRVVIAGGAPNTVSMGEVTSQQPPPLRTVVISAGNSSGVVVRPADGVLGSIGGANNSSDAKVQVVGLLGTNAGGVSGQPGAIQTIRIAGGLEELLAGSQVSVEQLKQLIQQQQLQQQQQQQLQQQQLQQQQLQQQQLQPMQIQQQQQPMQAQQHIQQQSPQQQQALKRPAPPTPREGQPEIKRVHLANVPNGNSTPPLVPIAGKEQQVGISVAYSNQTTNTTAATTMAGGSIQYNVQSQENVTAATNHQPQQQSSPQPQIIMKQLDGAVAVSSQPTVVQSPGLATQQVRQVLVSQGQSGEQQLIAVAPRQIVLAAPPGGIPGGTVISQGTQTAVPQHQMVAIQQKAGGPGMLVATSAGGQRQLVPGQVMISQGGGAQVLVSHAQMTSQGPVFVTTQPPNTTGTQQYLVASSGGGVTGATGGGVNYVVAQPQTALVQGQTQTVLVAQTPQQQGTSAKTIIILQSQGQKMMMATGGTGGQQVVMQVPRAVATASGTSIIQAAGGGPVTSQACMQVAVSAAQAVMTGGQSGAVTVAVPVATAARAQLVSNHGLIGQPQVQIPSQQQIQVQQQPGLQQAQQNQQVQVPTQQIQVQTIDQQNQQDQQITQQTQNLPQNQQQQQQQMLNQQVVQQPIQQQEQMQQQIVLQHQQIQNQPSATPAPALSPAPSSSTPTPCASPAPTVITMAVGSQQKVQQVTPSTSPKPSVSPTLKSAPAPGNVGSTTLGKVIPTSSVIMPSRPTTPRSGQDADHSQQHSTVASNSSRMATNPSPHRELHLVQFLCEWRGCMRSFKSANEVYMHACREHCPISANEEQQCLWERCDGMRRKRFSLMTHLFDRHCNAEVLRMMAMRRRQLSQSGRSEIPPPTPPPPHPGYAPNAAFHAIKRHALEFVNPKELMDDNEGPVTKSIRLTSSLILRNLVIYSTSGRRFLRSYEPHLASVALSNVESSRTIAQVLYDMNQQADQS